MYFSPILTPTVLWLLAASAICVTLSAAIYFTRVRTVAAFRRRADKERPDKPDAEFEPASVIVYSQGDAENLTSMLESLLAQDYPAPFEIVVVNEGESSDVRDAVSMLRSAHNNLYLTFTPEGVVNLSRKKLALTLGVKAARYDVVVLTTTAAEIESPLWLKRMMAPFSVGSPVEVVLGFAYVDPAEDSARGCRRRAFDYVADSVRWLGVAIAGKPFRGTEYNLAYRKEVFLRNKGFARSLNLHYGDDDIFVSQIANGVNTAVELSDESIVRLRHGNHPRIFSERVLRRCFTESFIRRRPRLLYPLAGWLQLGAIGCAAVASWMAWPNLQASAIGVVILAIIIVLDITTWRKVMAALKSRPLLLTLPWFALTYPLRKFGGRIRGRLGKHKKYTWD